MTDRAFSASTLPAPPPTPRALSTVPAVRAPAPTAGPRGIRRRAVDLIAPDLIAAAGPAGREALR